MVVFWIVVALAFAVAEVVTLALFAGFFALAAVGAAIAAALGGDLLVQALVVFVMVVVGIVVARPPLMRYLRSQRQGPTVSGAQEMVGKTGVVTERIAGEQDHENGHVRLQGETWLAVTADGAVVEPGTQVRVVDIRRATLVVAALPAAANATAMEEVQ